MGYIYFLFVCMCLAFLQCIIFPIKKHLFRKTSALKSDLTTLDRLSQGFSNRRILQFSKSYYINM